MPSTPSFSLRRSAELSQRAHSCRFCRAPLHHLVVDLGLQPLCQSRVTVEQLDDPETFYPLRAYVCDQCWLVQAHDHVSGEEIFSYYAYFSSYSDSWLAHHRDHVEQLVQTLRLGAGSLVVEVGSNDGYLLQNFVRLGIPCLGVEPAANVAEVAKSKGVPCRVEFFGVETARRMVAEGIRPDLIMGNNVLAHVPDLNDFVAGFKILLRPGGRVIIESPHLMRLFEENQYDTIYQEHYCYYSLLTLRRIFAHHGLHLFDVQELPTHGGSLRLSACHAEDQRPTSAEVLRIEAEERAKGYEELTVYRAFAEQVAASKRELLTFLIEAKGKGKRIAAYGAPGKGNTLLNYCGIREDFIDYTVDRNPMKQNTFLVGSRIPVYDPDMIRQTQPEYLLLLPWNLQDEIMGQMKHIREWGGKFVIPIPRLTVVD